MSQKRDARHEQTARLSEEVMRPYREKYERSYREEHHNPEAQRKRAQEHNQRREAAMRENAAPKRLAKYALGLLCFAALCGLIYQRSIVSQIQRDILTATNELQRLNKQADDHRLAISRNDNIYTIKQKAAEDLHMDYPTDEQLRTVTLPTLPDEPKTEPAPEAVEPVHVRLWNMLIGANQ